MIVVPSDARIGRACRVHVQSGKLDGTDVIFQHSDFLASPVVPENLTAMEGDTLAKLDLNAEPQDGVFAWEDPDQDVGKAGDHSFQATYNLEYNGHHYIKYDIEVPVSVKGTAANPTPTPVVPTSTPTKAPTPTPIIPTPTPVVPTQKPTKSPASPTPEVSKQPAATATPRPDESKLTGNQIEKLKDLSLLLATGKQKGNNGIKLTWREKKDCDGYEVYWSYCDGKQNFKKIKTVGSIQMPNGSK